MKNNFINKIAELRVAVALLGEAHNWWHTSFFKESSDAFLDYIFPKSKNIHYTIACDAVRIHTDQKVGANHYHLFRLNIKFEELIHKQFRTENIRIDSKEAAIKTLKVISKDLYVDNSPGPKNIGSLDHLDENTIEAFAAEYLKAFEEDYETYPYLN